MASVIVGDWTHRRGDPGGARAVSAEIDKPRPTIAWSWRPEHRGRVDQVRIVGESVVVATMAPSDPLAPGWEHAVVYALDMRTGAEVARRVLPDPVPIAAMVVGGGEVHVVATRKGEPIFWYALSAPELAPRHRNVVATAGIRHDDVLDAWAAPDGGLWLELDAAIGAGGRHVFAYAFADATGHTPAACGYEEERAGEGTALARDACVGDNELFAPVDGRWLAMEPSVPPALSRLDPRANGGSPPRSEATWASATLVGPSARMHALGAAGFVCAVAAAEDPARPRRARVEVFGVDRASGVVGWRAASDRVALRPPLSDHARIARRPNGEVLFQSVGANGTPCTPLVCARPDGRLDTISLGARGRCILDAALGDSVLVHREHTDGSVEVAGYAVDDEGRLLGRRARATWAINAGDLGGATTVYGGAGAIVVRGAHAICAVKL